MKRLFLLILTVAAISYICDKVNDFLISHTFDDTFEVNLPANGPTNFSEEFDFDATENQEVADNINNVSGYKLSSLKFSISEFVPDTGMVEGVFSFYFKNGSGGQIGDMTTVSIDNLFALSASGDKVDIPLTQGTINAVQNELGSTNKVTAVIDGSVSDVPVHFFAHIFLTVEADIKF